MPLGNLMQTAALMRPASATAVQPSVGAVHSKWTRRRFVGLVVGSPLVLTPANAVTLSKEYRALATELVTGLKSVVELDLSGAPEREVRRKADPEKERIRTFIRNWSPESEVRSTASFQEITFALRELSEFYTTRGERARLTQEAAQSIVAHLDAAQKALS